MSEAFAKSGPHPGPSPPAGKGDDLGPRSDGPASLLAEEGRGGDHTAPDPTDIHSGDWVDRLLPRWAEPYARLAAGAVVMRGAGCTLNDIADRDYDGQVARTRLRPIPSGRVGVPQAVLF